MVACRQRTTHRSLPLLPALAATAIITLGTSAAAAPPPPAADEIVTQQVLLTDAVQTHGAVALDGSPAQYYIKTAISAASQHKW